MVQHNRLSHALLFLGKEGSGALQLALAFAQYIVCEKVNGRQPAAEPSLFGEPDPGSRILDPTPTLVASAPPAKKPTNLSIPIYISRTR